MHSGQAHIRFKFYEEAAEKAKTHAWSQTTWVLALNAGILAISVDFYANHSELKGYIEIEAILAGVGIVLCLFLMYLLQEMGKHIRKYWTASNKIAVNQEDLKQFLSDETVTEAAEPGYEADFPPFCRRLQGLAFMFLVGHAGWLWVATKFLLG